MLILMSKDLKKQKKRRRRNADGERLGKWSSKMKKKEVIFILLFYSFGSVLFDLMRKMKVCYCRRSEKHWTW